MYGSFLAMELPSNLSNAHQEIVNLQTILSARTGEIKKRDHEILRLKEKNAQLLQKLFGRSSEKRTIETRNGSTQYTLSLTEEPVKTPAAAGTAPVTIVEQHTRLPTRKKRLEGELSSEGKFPEHLPREVTILDDGEQAGAIFDTKITERLCVRPSQLFVEEIRRIVRKSDRGSLSQPPVPETPLPRRCVDASFLAYIIIMKFCWHLPLYRQEQMLKAQGVTISRDTLIRYVIDVAELLGKLYNVLLASAFSGQHIYADETPVLVGKGVKGNRAFTESRFWPFMGNGAIVFIFARTRAAKEIEPLLEAYKGHLQVDGYTVYESIADKFPDISLVFCWAHVRRKFIEAEKYYPKETKEALRYIRALYWVEARAKGKDNSEILRLRTRFSVKILKLFKQWLDKHFADPTLLPKSSLMGAIAYAHVRWDGLCRYTTDPVLTIDSNPIERQIRPVALGRKNWLFCASETGAEAACTMYSLIASCKLAGVDPNKYLTDVLNRINDHSQLKLEELLPQNWKPLENNSENSNPSA